MANTKEFLSASKFNRRDRSAPIRIMKRVGYEMVPASPKNPSRLPVAVISRTSHDANLDIISEIKKCLEDDGQEIADLTVELDNFTHTERLYISSIIADNCICLEHIRYKSVVPLQRLERMEVPILNQVRTLEFLLDGGTNVAYDAFILSHLRAVPDQLETLNLGTIDLGRCLRNMIFRPLTRLQAPLNEDTYNFLDYHCNLEVIKISGNYCDLERLQPYIQIIRILYISCNIITNINAISKLRSLTHLEINCSHPNETYIEVVNAIKCGNMSGNVIDFKVRQRL